MTNLFAGVVFFASAAAIYFLVRVIIAAVQKVPVAPFAKKLGISCVIVVVGFVGFGVFQTPEERAEILAKQAARENPNPRPYGAPKAEEKTQESKKMTAEEQRQKQAEFVAEQKAKKESKMIQEITTGWNMATTDTDNDNSNPQKVASIITKYPDYVHNAPENWISAENAMKKPFDYYGKVVNMSGRVYSIKQMPPDSSDVKALGGQCYHAMLAIGEGYDPVTVSMYIVGDSSGIAEDSYINVKGYIYGHAALVNRFGGSSRGLAFVGFNE